MHVHAPGQWQIQKIVLAVWDAVDTSPDIGGSKCPPKTFEMAIRHNRRTTRRVELDIEFSVAGFTFTYVQKYFSGPLT